MKLPRRARGEGKEVEVHSGAAAAHAPAGGSATSSPDPASTSAWTNGSALLTRALSVGLVGCVILGVVGGVHAFMPQSSVAAPAAEVQPGLTGSQQEAGAFAANYLAAWFAATATEPGALVDYVGSDVAATLGSVPTAARQIQISTIAPSDGDLVTVDITALVDEVDEAGQTVAVRRAFQVVVAVDDAGTLAAVGLPAPIALPAQATAIATGYDVALSPEDAPAQTARDFLAAYLTGAAELDRYIAPGTDLSAVAPAPYASVSLTAIDADAEIDVPPADGSTLELYVQADLTAAGGQVLPASYALTLTARADRWEVSALNPAPLASDLR